MKTKSLVAAAAVALGGLASPAVAETLLERGTYLMRSIVACGNCHTPAGPNGPIPGRELAGGLKIEEPPFTAYAPNITPDKDTGIGNWTDAQIIAAIREGKRPDGTIIGPPMPIELYRRMSDRDAQAIVAYLRSVPAVRNEVPKSVYRMPLPASYGPPVKNVKAPERSKRVAYGAYLAGPLGHCVECHTPMLPDGRRDYAKRIGSGGPPIHGPFGPVVPRNLTPHRETGLGTWTDAQIKTAITKGVSRDGRQLSPPMAFPYYARMSERDLNALVAYLRSLKPVAAFRP